MSVFVKKTSGEIEPVDFEATETIQNLKAQVSKIAGIIIKLF